MVTELAKGVYWVGVVDWGLRHFHGHELSTHRGSTYNAYLIVDEKIALVDTVWGPFADQLLANIAEITPLNKIDYVIANHAETDHAGALPAVMRQAPQAKLIVSTKGADSFPGNYHADWALQTVKSGDTLSLGKKALLFIEAPMLHWPDSMFTYIAGPGVLLPNDAFGQHYATAFRFNDQVDTGELYDEARKYYANILMPYSSRVPQKIAELMQLGLRIEMIAPSHGVIWRKDPMQIVTQYQAWAEGKPEKQAVIIYDSMWNATRFMAEAIGEGLAAAGIEYRLCHAATTDRNDLIVEAFRSSAVIVGSSTLNNGLLPTIWPVLKDMKGLRFSRRLAGAFGSYGWSGESVKLIEEHLHECKFEIAMPSLACKWQPDAPMLERCRQAGRDMGAAMNRE